MAGRLDTPPAPYRLRPGISRSRLALSLVAGTLAARLAVSSVAAPGNGLVLTRLALTVTGGRVLVAVLCASAWLHSSDNAGKASAMAWGSLEIWSAGMVNLESG
jgi:hypothetical protein